MAVPAADRDVLASIFASRLSLACKTDDEAAEEARILRRHTATWIDSDSQKVHSFLWFCDVLNLEASAVRRAMKER